MKVPCFEYVAGATLDVNFLPHSRFGESLQQNMVTRVSLGTDVSLPIVLKVLRPFTPFTMGAVMQVEVVPRDNGAASSLPGDQPLVLKLYDRRSANNHRGGDRKSLVYSHTPETEALYQEWLSSPDVFEGHCTPHGQPNRSYMSRFRVQLEARCLQKCEEGLASELSVYEQFPASFKDDGDRARFPIPRYYGKVEYHSPIGPVQGILIEYIPNAMPLKDYVRLAASCIQMEANLVELCDLTMSTILPFIDSINAVSNHLNVRNMLVQLSQPIPDSWEGVDPLSLEVRRCVMIDFGHARARDPAETDAEWRKAKIKAAEELSIAEGLCNAIKEGLKGSCRFHGSQCRHTSAQPFYYVGKRKYGHVFAEFTECPLWYWSIENRFNAATSKRATLELRNEHLRGSEEPGDIPDATRQMVEDWRSTVPASDAQVDSTCQIRGGLEDSAQSMHQCVDCEMHGVLQRTGGEIREWRGFSLGDLVVKRVICTLPEAIAELTLDPICIAPLQSV